MSIASDKRQHLGKNMFNLLFVSVFISASGTTEYEPQTHPKQWQIRKQSRQKQREEHVENKGNTRAKQQVMENVK